MDRIDNFIHECSGATEGILFNKTRYEIAQPDKWRQALTKYINILAKLGIIIHFGDKLDIKARLCEPFKITLNGKTGFIQVHSSRKGFEWARIEISYDNKKGKYQFVDLMIRPSMLQSMNDSSNPDSTVKAYLDDKYPGWAPHKAPANKEEKKIDEDAMIRAARYQIPWAVNVHEIRDKTIKAIKSELTLVFSKGKFVDYPLIFEDESDIADWWRAEDVIIFFRVPFIADAFFNEGRERIDAGDFDGVSYTASEEDLLFLNLKSDEEISAYVDVYTKIVKKWMDKAIREMKAAKIPVRGWDYEHYTEEYFCEEVYVMLQDKPRASFDAFIDAYLN